MLPREGIEDAAIGMLQQPAQSTVYPISKRLLAISCPGAAGLF